TATDAPPPPSPRQPMRPVQRQITLPPDGRHFTLYRDGRRVILHATHKGQAAALAAFRRLEEQGQGCVVVRLDNDYARPMTVLRACGFDPDGLEHDLAFRADVIRACTRPGG